jgi:hypothetical protein
MNDHPAAGPDQFGQRSDDPLRLAKETEHPSDVRPVKPRTGLHDSPDRRAALQCKRIALCGGEVGKPACCRLGYRELDELGGLIDRDHAARARDKLGQVKGRVPGTGSNIQPVLPRSDTCRPPRGPGGIAPELVLQAKPGQFIIAGAKNIRTLCFGHRAEGTKGNRRAGAWHPSKLSRQGINCPMPLTDQLLAQYASTQLAFTRWEKDGVSKCTIDLRQAVGPTQVRWLRDLGLGKPFAVITACNPGGEALSEDENDELAAELKEVLEANEVDTSVSCTGCSADMTHFEPGLAIVVEEPEAADVAEQFDQLAMFWFDGERFWIVPVTAGGKPVGLPIV